MASVLATSSRGTSGFMLSRSRAASLLRKLARASISGLSSPGTSGRALRGRKRRRWISPRLRDEGKCW